MGLGRAGNRIHGTRSRTSGRFAEMEKDFLRPLPDLPPELACWASVKLHGNCMSSSKKPFNPPRHAGAQVPLAACHGENRADLPRTAAVATHPRLHSRRTEHGQDICHRKPRLLMRDPQWCLTQAAKVGGAAKRWSKALRHRVSTNLRAVQGLLQLQGRTANDDWRRPAPEPGPWGRHVSQREENLEKGWTSKD